MPSSYSVGLGGLPLSRTDFHDFREHRPRMRTGNLNAPYGEFVTRAPTSVVPGGVNRARTPGIHAVCDRTDHALAATAVPPNPPAGVGQNRFSHAPTQPRPPTLGTEPLDINCPAPPLCIAARLVLGTDNVPPTTSSPAPISRSDVGDLGSQASPAQLQTASRRDEAKRQSRLVVPPDPPPLSSASQARPPSLVPSNLISTRTRRRRAAAAGPPPKPVVNSGFHSPAPAPPPAAKSPVVIRRPSRSSVPSPLIEKPGSTPCLAPRRDRPVGHRRG